MSLAIAIAIVLSLWALGAAQAAYRQSKKNEAVPGPQGPQGPKGDSWDAGQLEEELSEGSWIPSEEERRQFDRDMDAAYRIDKATILEPGFVCAACKNVRVDEEGSKGTFAFDLPLIGRPGVIPINVEICSECLNIGTDD